MPTVYAQSNKSTRYQLQDYINRLTEQQLSQPLSAGWTVAGVLAHLSFWDQRAMILLKKWQEQGIGPSEADTDVVNEATRLLCINIAPRVAVQLAIASAEAIDQAIESLPPEFLARIELEGKTVRLDRGHHRLGHLKEIEAALGL